MRIDTSEETACLTCKHLTKLTDYLGVEGHEHYDLGFENPRQTLNAEP